MQKTNNELLKERIEQNYTDFKSETLAMDEEDIYGMAAKIAAVEDTYFQVTEHKYLDEDEAGYLLTFHSPLAMIADFLEKMRRDEPVEVDEALFELFDREDNEDYYVTVKLAGELEQQYGAGANIRLSLLSEAVIAGEKYLRLLKLIDGDDKGANLCADEE